LATAVLVIAMSACNEKKSKDSIIGSWIMPIEGQPGKIMGHRTKRFFQWSGKMGERF